MSSLPHYQPHKAVDCLCLDHCYFLPSNWHPESDQNDWLKINKTRERFYTFFILVAAVFKLRIGKASQFPSRQEVMDKHRKEKWITRHHFKTSYTANLVHVSNFYTERTLFPKEDGSTRDFNDLGSHPQNPKE